MSIKLPNISTLVSILGELGGVVGVILGAVNAGDLTTPIRSIITGVSGILVIVTHHHTTKKAVTPP